MNTMVPLNLTSHTSEPVLVSHGLGLSWLDTTQTHFMAPNNTSYLILMHYAFIIIVILYISWYVDHAF